MTSRQMALVAFMQAGSTSVYAGSWRHPAAAHGYHDASYYAKIGRQLEEGCCDLMFFDDRLAMPGIYGGSVADAVKYGARPGKLDLSIVLGVLGQGASHIGLVGGRGPPPPTRRSPSRAPSPRSITCPAAGRPGTSSPRSTTARPRTSGWKHIWATTPATTGLRNSSKPPSGCGTPGKTTPSCTTGSTASTPTRTRCTS